MASRPHVKKNGEIVDSWEEIIENIHSGKHKEIYAPGNYKKMDLGDDGILNCVLLGFDKHTKSSGGKAPTSWLSKELTATTTAYAREPFATCSSHNGTHTALSNGIKARLDNVIKPKMPEVVRKNLVTITVYFNASGFHDPSNSYPSAYTGTFSAPTELFVPSQEELSRSGIFASLLGSNTLRVKCCAGSTTPAKWPTRDCGAQSSVNTSGTRWNWEVSEAGAIKQCPGSSSMKYGIYHLPVGFCL